MRIVVAITGASGGVYARRLVQLLAQAGNEVHLVISPNGRRVLADELGWASVGPAEFGASAAGRIKLYRYDDVGCELASGSFATDGMIICPCSSNTLAGVAAGLADNLILRAAQVSLKERRRLILCTREMPVGPIEIRNMLRAARAGAVICPASPGFYMKPTCVDDLVDFVVGRLLDLAGVPHDLQTRWAEQLAKAHLPAAGGRSRSGRP